MTTREPFQLSALQALRAGFEGGVKPQRCQRFVPVLGSGGLTYWTRCDRPPGHQLHDGTWECSCNHDGRATPVAADYEIEQI